MVLLFFCLFVLEAAASALFIILLFGVFLSLLCVSSFCVACIFICLSVACFKWLRPEAASCSVVAAASAAAAAAAAAADMAG